jgi:Uma2 family endonuclease
MSAIQAPEVSENVFAPDRLLTAADLAALPQQLPSGPVDYELDDGRLVIMSPAGHWHGHVQATLAAQFKQHAEWQGHGRAYTDVGVVLRRGPDRVVSPDLAFVGNGRLPVCETPEGYLETIPNLVVEVRSKNDSRQELSDKADDYLRSGVDIVWIVDSDARTVSVHGPNATPQTFRDGDVLQAPNLIPGFALPVTSVFDPPTR